MVQLVYINIYTLKLCYGHFPGEKNSRFLTKDNQKYSPSAVLTDFAGVYYR